MRVWILGAGGQLGTGLIDACQLRHVPFHASKRADADINDFDALRRKAEKLKATHVINCAAYTNVDKAEEESKKAFLVNGEGAENLGRLAKEFPLSILHVSTDYVFDGQKGSPYVETDVPNPLGVYGKSKLEGEQRLLSVLPTACIVRTSWIFGNRGNNFISSVISMLQNKEKVVAAHDQINRVAYNIDLALALLDLSSHSGVFHFANEGEVSRFQIVEEFFAETKRRQIPIKCKSIEPCSITDFPAASLRPLYSALDTAKVERALGRKPRMWKTVLREYFDHVAATL